MESEKWLESKHIRQLQHQLKAVSNPPNYKHKMKLEVKLKIARKILKIESDLRVEFF